VTSIGEFVFGTCKSLTSVTLPKDITQIGMSMFIECSKLESIEIPQKVTAIGNYAFYNCNSLSNVRFSTQQPPTFGMNAFANTKDGINVFLKNGANKDNWREKLIAAGMINPNFIIDITPPTAEIKVGEAVFHSAIKPVTFDTLIKDKAEITITASDTESAIQKIEYQEVSSEDEYNVDGRWKPYTEKFDVNHMGKNIIYVRVTDSSDNQAIINTNGFIIYTDSQFQTESTEFDRKEDNQKDILVKLNLKGNTFKNITNGETVLKSGLDYMISNSPRAKNPVSSPESGLTLTIKKSYLAKLQSGIQTLTFYFNPYGIESSLAINTPLEITIKDTGHIHEYDTVFTIEKAATCTEKGKKSRHCKGFALCGDRTDITEIELAPHTGVATCHAKAICSVCNKEYGEKNPNNHDGGTELRNEKSATHKEEGYTGDTCCKSCNMPIKLGEVLPKIPHTPDGKWKSDEKSHWLTCKGCNENYDIAEHTWATEASILSNGWITEAMMKQLFNEFKANDANSENMTYFGCTVCMKVKKEETKITTAVIPIKKGDNSIYIPGTAGGATFTSEADIKDFLSVSMDGIPIKLEHIKLKEGSTIVTISREYMDTLPNGKHTVSIYSTTGTATANFTVVENKEIVTPKTPKTGDNGNMPLWISLLFVSGGALTLFGISKKRRKVNGK
ncbi:MAG: leucine-rich repeat protein, partial [Lachnospiraceae bacterium]